MKFKTNTKECKTNEQRNSVKYVLNAQMDMLVILPTGCGKSLLFFLYAYKNRELVSVIVIPTISLCEDLKRRAMKHGISTYINIEAYINENSRLWVQHAIDVDPSSPIRAIVSCACFIITSINPEIPPMNSESACKIDTNPYQPTMSKSLPNVSDV